MLLVDSPLYVCHVFLFVHIIKPTNMKIIKIRFLLETCFWTKVLHGFVNAPLKFRQKLLNGLGEKSNLSVDFELLIFF